MPTVGLAEDIYNALAKELLSIQIHSQQIFREYERHKTWAATVEQRLQFVQERMLKNYNVDLRIYARQPLPNYPHQL